MILAASPHLLTWAIAGLATLGVIVRPFGWPEAVWAALGACLLVVLGLIPASLALTGALKGTDVYFFLIGMMLLAEIARKEGLFDWLAGVAVRGAKGSATRLFTLVYLVGAVVTVFLSNDACAVVLTPAVYAAAKAAKANPLPYLFICAFIANAASFVLPISNPANLVVYAAHMPPLGEWLARFGLPSALSIGVTYAVLRLTQAGALRAPIEGDVEAPALSATGKVAAAGIAATALVLLWASAVEIELGVPTFLAGAATAIVVLALNKGKGALEVAGDISWSVLPLVAGLFILVEALDHTGVLKALAGVLRDAAAQSETGAAWQGGAIVALACNLVNNLPAGLLAGAAVQTADVSPKIAGAILIGVDLGPNLSITGSLATILWLVAIRREGEDVSAWAFLKLGALVMPPALIAALGALLLV